MRPQMFDLKRLVSVARKGDFVVTLYKVMQPCLSKCESPLADSLSCSKTSIESVD